MLTLEERFFAKTVRAENGCLLWTGAVKQACKRDKRGGQALPHGRIWLEGKACPAHRVSYMLAHGHKGCTLDFFGLLEHDCDNPRCVEPKHLYESDLRENLKSSYARGRRNPQVVLEELGAWFMEQGVAASLMA